MTEVLETAPPVPEPAAPVKSMRMPVVRPEFVLLCNQIAGKRYVIPFTWNGQPSALRFSAVDHFLSPLWTVKVKIAGHDYALHLHRLPEVGWMMPELAGVDLTALPEELACSVLQSCLGEVSSQLTRFGVDLVVTGFGPFSHARAGEEHLEWSITRGKEAPWMNGWVSADDAGLYHLTKLLGGAPLEPAPEPLDVPVSLALGIGSMRCPLSLLKGLEVHDVILANVRSYLSLRECTLLLKGRKIGSVVATGSQVTINQINLYGTQPMAESDSEKPALNDLEIELTFQVGQTSITLGELRALAPGAVFELGSPVGETVSIHANGKLIGHGELLEIGDKVGVRVTELK